MNQNIFQQVMNKMYFYGLNLISGKYLGSFSLIIFLKTECLCCHLVINIQLSHWLKSMLKMSSITYNES